MSADTHQMYVEGGFITTGLSGNTMKRMDQLQPVLCAACGKDMRNAEHGSLFIGTAFTVDIDGTMVKDADDAARWLAFYKKQMGVYAPLLEVGTKLHIDVCWECWFKSMGIPVPDQTFEVS